MLIIKVNNKEKLRNLIEHARKTAQDIYLNSIELTDESFEEAQKKLKYGKLVLEKISNVPSTSDASGDPEMADLIYQCIVSVRPSLLNAINDMENRLKQKNQDKGEDSEICEEELLRQMKESVGKMVFQDLSNQLIPEDDPFAN